MQMIVSDVYTLLIFLGVMALAYISNVVLSMYKNISVLQDTFDKKKFYQGILKCLVLIVGSVLLVLAIDFAVFIFNKYGIISDQVGDLVTITSMLVTLGVAIVKYIKEAYTKYVDIINISK